MQNKYVGDIGDYCKLGLLRWLTGAHPDCSEQKLSLGVCWYAVPDNYDPPGNRDGRHIGYLGLKQTHGGQIFAHPPSARLRQFDPSLWDSLRNVVLSGKREISALESISRFDHDASFHSAELPNPSDFRGRLKLRSEWFERVMRNIGHPELIFVDPDNGLASEKMRSSSKSVIKHLLFDELVALSGQSKSGIVFYHHLGQHLPHDKQLSILKQRLNCFEDDCGVSSLVFNRHSSRAFILLSKRHSESGRTLKQRFASFIEKWKRPEGAVVIR